MFHQNQLNNEFTVQVDEILEKYKDAEIETIKEVVERVTEAYVQKYDKKPESYQLSRLSNLILKDSIRNPDSYKVQKEDYPFHSQNQTKRRKRKEFVAQDTTLAFMDYKVKAKLSTAPPKEDRTVNLKGGENKWKQLYAKVLYL